MENGGSMKVYNSKYGQHIFSKIYASLLAKGVTEEQIRTNKKEIIKNIMRVVTDTARWIPWSYISLSAQTTLWFGKTYAGGLLVEISKLCTTPIISKVVGRVCEIKTSTVVSTVCGDNLRVDVYER